MMGVRFLTAGESHGSAMLAVLEGIPAGLVWNTEFINHELARRQQGFGAGPRMKLEQDQVQVLSGVMEGITIGSPIGLVIENQDHKRWKGKAIEPFTIPRPGHADLTGAIKYGYKDLRPALERASARETVARVAVGAVCKLFLAQFDIKVGGYVISIGNIEADLKDCNLINRIRLAELSVVRCPSVEASEAMENAIRNVIQQKDTLGGVIEVVVMGLPAGLGSFVHWDRRLDSQLGAAILSVPAIKGVELGSAFENARLSGSQVQDAIFLEGEKLVRQTNRAGGLEGGVTNGEPVILRAAMKPIATTLKPQLSVDLGNGHEVETRYERSDFCPVPRAVVVLEAVVSYVIAQALVEKLGGDSMDEMLFRYATLRQARLSDLMMESKEHIYWQEK